MSSSRPVWSRTHAAYVCAGAYVTALRIFFDCALRFASMSAFGLGRSVTTVLGVSTSRIMSRTFSIGTGLSCAVRPYTAFSTGGALPTTTSCIPARLTGSLGATCCLSTVSADRPALRRVGEALPWCVGASSIEHDEGCRHEIHPVFCSGAPSGVAAAVGPPRRGGAGADGAAAELSR